MSTFDPEPRPARPAGERTPPKIPSAKLMQGRREIVIQHGVDEYRLRITAMGKLILTK